MKPFDVGLALGAPGLSQGLSYFLALLAKPEALSATSAAWPAGRTAAARARCRRKPLDSNGAATQSPWANCDAYTWRPAHEASVPLTRARSRPCRSAAADLASDLTKP